MGANVSNLTDHLPNVGAFHCAMIGLDSSGKTTVLYRLKYNQYMNTAPTIGFNCEKVRLKSQILAKYFKYFRPRGHRRQEVRKEDQGRQVVQHNSCVRKIWREFSSRRPNFFLPYYSFSSFELTVLLMLFGTLEVKKNWGHYGGHIHDVPTE